MWKSKAITWHHCTNVVMVCIKGNSLAVFPQDKNQTKDKRIRKAQHNPFLLSLLPFYRVEHWVEHKEKHFFSLVPRSVLSDMVVSLSRRGATRYQAMSRLFKRRSKKFLEDDFAQVDSPASSSSTTRHVVIVMDGLREFTTKPLKWALENNMATTGCIVTLLGTMPWLNIPLSSKTRRDVWGVGFEELSMAQERSEAKSYPKYLKLQAVIDICNKFGVKLQKEVVMGFPLKLIVLEKIIKLNATWVVFDRHHKKDREYFARRIPFNMIMMNENGEADHIRGQPMNYSGEFTPGQSPVSLLPTPQLVISEYWREILV